METNNEGSGWIVKAPFTTNGAYVKYAKSVNRVLFWLKSAGENLFGSIPYVMVQACMYNRKEYKIIALGGEPLYVSNIAGHGSKCSSDGINKAFSLSPHVEIMNFASAAINRCIESCPYLLCDGLFRVDIFQRKDGTLVVNEFENLEANHPAGIKSNEDAVYAYLRIYWSRKLIACFVQLLF